MKFKIFIKEYFYSQFFKHFLMTINLINFFLISFFSLTLDTIFPFNIVNIIFVAIFIVVTIVFSIINKVRPAICVFTFCYLGILLSMIASYAVHGFSSFPKTPVLITLFSLFVFFWLLQNKKDITIYIFAFLIASWCFVIAFAIVERSAILNPDFSYRAGSFFGNANDVARHLMFSFLINLYFVYTFKNTSLKVIVTTFSGFCLYLLLLTGSMSNLILIAVSLFVFFYVIANKKTKRIIVPASVALIIVFAALIFLVPTFAPLKNRALAIISVFFEAGNYRYDSSTLGRLNAAVNAFKLFFDSPLFGNGYNSVVNNYKIMAHNNIAEIAADYGLLALILEELVMIFPLFKKNKNWNKQKVFIKTFGIYLILIQFFLVIFNSKVESILIPLIYIVLDQNESILNFVRKQANSSKSDGYYEVNI